MGSKRDRQEQDTSLEEQEQAVFRKSKVTVRSPIKQENMEEIKRMLEEVPKSIKKELDGMKMEIRESINEVKGDIRELKEQWRENRESMENIKEEINKIKQADQREKQGMIINMDGIERRLEKIEKKKTRNNLIVTGLNTEGQKEDQLKETMRVMLERELGVKTEIGRAVRINNQKCLIEMKEWRDKLSILTEKNRLKGRKIFIDTDLTKKEREVQKKIRDRAREERGKGEWTKVGYKKLFISGKEYRWDERREELVDSNIQPSKNH